MSGWARARVLGRSFYGRDTVDVAVGLLGCRLVHDTGCGRVAGRIVEVEIYQGEDDPACHAAAGRTPRTAPLYGPPGWSYVYLIYGMYYCLNVVTRSEGQPSAVLIRAVEPLEGIDRMRARRSRRRGVRAAPMPDRQLADGPGKLCDAFDVNLEHNRMDLTCSGLRIEAGGSPGAVVWTPRVGVSVGTDRYWRGMIQDSPFVSKSKLNRRVVAEPRPRSIATAHEGEQNQP